MKRILILISSVLLLIALAVFLTAYFLPRPYEVHYHANFAVYMDGQKVNFSKPEYMEEVSRCNVTSDVRPEDRIHLHNNDGDTVHVHMAAATWGDLFSNLEWNFGSGYLVDASGKITLSGSGKNLIFILNGKPVQNPNNRSVKSEDQLLVWYGTWIDVEIAARAKTLVSASADEYNHKADPASCSTNRTAGILDAIKTALTGEGK